MSKYNVGLKTLLQEGLLEAEFYGFFVYKFGTNFSEQFEKIVTRYKMDILHSCLLTQFWPKLFKTSSVPSCSKLMMPSVNVLLNL